uniref:Pectinesterase n=1 Tax=Oryza nivara TaxID=4536 RepID=A0A0E0IN66_ORYNI
MAILDSNPPPMPSSQQTAQATTPPSPPLSQPRRRRAPRGTYNELITIGQNTWNLTLIGDGMDVTIITGNQSVGGGVSSTSKTGTVTVDGIGFVAIDLTIENTAGAENEQAVALLSKLNHKELFESSSNQ